MKAPKVKLIRLALAATVSFLVAGASSGAMAQDQTRDQDRLHDPIYGSQLITQQERIQYQAKIRTLKTEREREVFRNTIKNPGAVQGEGRDLA